MHSDHRPDLSPSPTEPAIPRRGPATSRRAFLAGAGTSLAWLGVSGLALPIRGRTEPGLRVESLSLTDGISPLRADGTTALAVGPGWHTSVELPLPGPMVTLGWDGPVDARLRVRSHGPDGWSQWMTVAADSQERPDPTSGEDCGRGGVGPIWVGHGADRFEVRLDEGELRGVRLDTLRPVEPQTKPVWFGISTAAAAPGPPGIIRRSQWGAGPWSDNGSCGPVPRLADRLERIFVHHTVNTNGYGQGDAAGLLRGIYHHHVNNNGWCDVAYNFFIDRFGRVFEGRTGSLDGPVIGGHAAGFNTGSLGIALLGQYHPGASPAAVGMSSAQRSALRQLIAWICGEYGLDARSDHVVESLGSNRFAAGTAVRLGTISTHRQVSITSCPGDNVVGHIGSLRSEVQREVIRSIPFPMPKWKPVKGQPGFLTLDAYGGLHPAGGQGILHPRPRGYWSGWAIARAGVRMDVGGYVLDGFGGLHAFGKAPGRTGSFYQHGADVCRDVARGPSDFSGWVLDMYGRLHPFGGAPAVTPSATWAGRNVARAIETTPDGRGGYVLDAFGALHQFGTAPAIAGTGPRWPNWDMARAFTLRPDGRSGWILDAWGGIHSFGGAPRFSSPIYRRDVDHARDVVASPNGQGGWVMTTDGYIAAFGPAPGVYHRSTWTGLDLGRTLMLRRGDTVGTPPVSSPAPADPGGSPTPVPTTPAPPDEIIT